MKVLLAMARLEKLEDLYHELIGKTSCTLFVAPPIRFTYKKSDYLYLLYKKLLSSADFKIRNISTLAHLQFVLWQILKKPSILHYHWLEISGPVSALSVAVKCCCIQWYKMLGGKVVWTVHNPLPPDSGYKWFNLKARTFLAKRSDLLVVECESAITNISTFFSVHTKKIRVWPHPSYPPQLIPRAAAVEAINHRYNVDLKVQDRLFLMFGHISPYKQIHKICQFFIQEPVQKKLIIAGPVKKGQMKYYKRLKKIASKHKNIVLIPQFIKEDSVPEFMNASDYLLFNYKNVLSTGGVPLAQSYNKPIILPKKGCLQVLNGNNLRFFNSQDELKEIIKSL